MAIRSRIILSRSASRARRSSTDVLNFAEDGDDWGSSGSKLMLCNVTIVLDTVHRHDKPHPSNLKQQVELWGYADAWDDVWNVSCRPAVAGAAARSRQRFRCRARATGQAIGATSRTKVFRPRMSLIRMDA